MPYQILITKSAEKEIEHLPKKTIINIDKAILALAHNPRPSGYTQLKNSKNIFRIRTGNYRIIYAIEDTIKIVEIRKVGHRKDVYKV